MSDTEPDSISPDAGVPTKPLLPHGMQEGAESALEVLSKLKLHNPVRRVVHSLLKQEAPERDAVSVLLHALRFPRPFHRREQYLAAWALGWIELNKVEHEQVRLHLERMVRYWKAKTTASIMIHGLAMGAGVQLPFALAVLSHTGPGVGADPFLLMLALTLVFGFAAITLLSCTEERYRGHTRRLAIAALGNLGSVKSLAVIGQAVVSDFYDPRDGIAMTSQYAVSLLPWTLRRLMVRLSPHHYHRLPRETVSTLCQVLNCCCYASTEPLAVEVLQALGKIGDGSAITSVERETKNGATEKIRQQAAIILPILQERQLRENAPTMLLRASEAAAIGPETLLRAAQEAPDTRSEELIRPAEESESETEQRLPRL